MSFSRNIIIACVSIIVSFFSIQGVAASTGLIKSTQLSAVYYLDAQRVRHAFPTKATYQSWYGSSFSSVTSITPDELAQYPVGKNITMRPGTQLVKVQTAPTVYAVEPGGVLRAIKDEKVAQGLYGANWTKRIVDIPDVFFDNYTIGEPLAHDYTTPDGVVYQDQTTNTYYYKSKGILRPFASKDDVAKNKFSVADALKGIKSLFIREKPISGFDESVFDPVAPAVTDTRDCENKSLKVAFVLVVDKNYTPEELANVEKMRSSIVGRFSWATNGLSRLDASAPTVVIYNDGHILEKNSSGEFTVRNELINTFYDTAPDVYDFIYVWTNFKIPSEDTNEIANFTSITNRQEGIGKGLLNRAAIFGSTGKLKGVIMMGNINKYDIGEASGLSRALNVSMHEILHQWAAYITFIDSNGKPSTALLRQDDKQHWNYYDGFISPLGGSGWTQTKPNVFSSGLATLPDSDLRPFSQLDLYLMGLIPKQFVQPVFYVKPTDPGVLGNEIGGTAVPVTIDQIIAANGEVKCSAD